MKSSTKRKQTLMSKKFFSMLLGGTLTMMVVSILLMSDQVIAGFVIGSDAVAGITLVTPMYSLSAFFVVAGMMLLTACKGYETSGQSSSTPVSVEGGMTFMTGGEQGTYYRYGLVLAQVISQTKDTALNTVVSDGSKENIEYDLELLGERDISYYAPLITSP